jgi:hypothetical protein
MNHIRIAKMIPFNEALCGWPTAKIVSLDGGTYIHDRIRFFKVGE